MSQPWKRHRAGLVGLILAAAGAMAAEPETEPIGLGQCILRALNNNRALQIERLNPEIARGLLAGSHGYYDPVLLSDLRQESAADSGGFDPADFSRDAVYEAESLASRTTLAGVLPWGLTYAAQGNYAHSEGTRNFLDFESYNVVGNVVVQQPLLRDLWIDEGRLLIRVNSRNIEISEHGVAFVTMDVINQVQFAYYELAFARELVQVRRQLVETREATLAALERQVAQGLLAAPDKLLAESQSALARTTLVEAENLQLLAETELRSLLGDDFSNADRVRLVPVDHLLVVPQELDLVESFKHGLNHRPDLAQLRLEVEKAELNLRYRRNQLFPSLNLVAGYGRRGANTSQVLPPATPQASATEAFRQFRAGEAPSDVFGVIFSMPLSLRAERGFFRAGKQQEAQAHLYVKQLEEQILREITDAFHTLRLSREKLDAARQSVRLTEEAVEAEKKKLVGGTSSLFVVLQLQNDVANARAAEVRARADFNQALSQLHFAEASLLERKRIKVDN